MKNVPFTVSHANSQILDKIRKNTGIAKLLSLESAKKIRLRPNRQLSTGDG
jgi:hypothetical protein